MDLTLYRTVLTMEDIFHVPVHPDGREARWRSQWRLVKLSKAKGAYLLGREVNSSWLLGKYRKLRGCAIIAQTSPLSAKFDLRYYCGNPLDVLRGKYQPVLNSSSIEEEEIGQVLRLVETDWLRLIKSKNLRKEVQGIDPGSCPVCTTLRGECPNCGLDRSQCDPI